VNPANARGLVPPRPNLGPEPWSDLQPIALFFWVGGALPALLVIWLVWRRLRSARIKQAGLDLSNQGPLDTSPRGRLVALSNSMRDVMANQFGTAWRAKTTEELSAEPRLEQALGDDQLKELTRFLDQVDRLKFAPERSNHHHQLLERELLAWEPRLAELKKKIQAKPQGRLKNRRVRSKPRNSNEKVFHAELATMRQTRGK
jgi:hypothetical protein